MKRFVSLFLIIMMLFSSMIFVNADTTSSKENIFNDVPQNHWARTEIEYFYEQGIVDGYGNGIFKPSGGVTREEFCKLLVATFNYEPETPKTQSFSDVKANRWSYKYVEACRNFLTAYSNPFGGLPSFRPAEDATREDIAVALVLMMGYKESDAKDKDYVLTAFSDGNSIAPALRTYVSIACEKGLINGYPDGTFGPTKGISRAETVVLLNRVTKQAAADLFPGTTQPEKPVTPVLPERPADPENPADPEKPVNPEKPTEPENPVTPEKPTKPSKEYIQYGVINEVYDAKSDDRDVQYIIGFVDGKAIEAIADLTKKATETSSTPNKTALVRITIDADGVITKVQAHGLTGGDVIDETATTVSGISSGNVKVDNDARVYKLSDSVVIYIWDADDEEWQVKRANQLKDTHAVFYDTDADTVGIDIVLAWK